MSLAFDHPAVLALLVAAALPLVATPFRAAPVSSLAAVPLDPLSTAVTFVLRAAAALAIAATVLGLAIPHLRAGIVERVGSGAHLVLLIDRSSSMDNSFADRRPSGAEEAKAAAAKRLLLDFVARRPNDRIGIAAFSTMPMQVLPLTDRHEAVQAAVRAIDRPGLAYTDVGRGLAMALGMFEPGTAEASRAVILVSDGAAVIGRTVQEALRDAVTRNPVNLYWLFLRTGGSKGIYEVPPRGEPDTPQTNPERHLHRFLGGLGVPYRAFEAGSPRAVEEAIAEIDRSESRPLRYGERIPRRDLSRHVWAVAAVCVALLLVGKLMERDLVRRADAAPGAMR